MRQWIFKFNIIYYGRFNYFYFFLLGRELCDLHKINLKYSYEGRLRHSPHLFGHIGVILPLQFKY